MSKQRDYSASGKRAREAEPYDANNSIIQKIATKVTELIPQSISKWFNTSRDSDNDEDFQDWKDAEQMELENPRLTPPAKRPRIRSDVVHPAGTFSIGSKNHAYGEKSDSDKRFSPRELEDSLDIAVPGPSGTRSLVSSTPMMRVDMRSAPTQRSKRNSVVSGQNNGAANVIDDNSESSESTSGCSSLIPQNTRQDGPSALNYDSPYSKKRYIENSKYNNSNFSNHHQSSLQSYLQNVKERETLRSQQPTFDISAMVHSREKSSLFSSPFYRGDTSFGGANAVNLHKKTRRDLQSCDVLQLKTPKRAQVEVKSLNTSNNRSGMSETAKKILQVLESFSSPITDAKKMPVKRRSPARSRDEPGMPTHRVGMRHMIRGLTVPTMADVIKIRRRKRLEDFTIEASKTVPLYDAPPAQPKEYHMRSAATEATIFRGKLQGKRGSRVNEEETVEMINLPAVQLPISTLPKFDIALPQNVKPSGELPGNSSGVFEFSDAIKVAGSSKYNSPNTSIKSTNLAFEEVNDSSSIGHDGSLGTTLFDLSHSSQKSVGNSLSYSGSSSNTKDAANDSNFIEVCPSSLENEKAVQSTINSEENDTKQSSNSVVQKAKVWECGRCLATSIGSKNNCVSCMLEASASSSKPPVKSPKTSPTSLAKTEKKSNGDLMSKFKPTKDSWECPGCMLRNPSSASTCPCCTTSKPGNEKVEDTPILTKSISNNISSSSWECPMCMVMNQSNALTCPCCQAAKPGTEAPKKSSSGFGDLFKKPTGTWNCDACLVQNKIEATKCIACETPKPGENEGSTSVSKSESKLKFNCEMPTGGQIFKFGVDKNDEKSSTMATIPVSSNGFTFGSNAAPSDGKTFSFGVTRSEPEAPKIDTPFGSIEKSNSEQTMKSFEREEEKAVQVPSKKKEDSPVAPSFSFGVPNKVNQEKISFGIPAATEGNVHKFGFEPAKTVFGQNMAQSETKKPVFGTSTSVIETASDAHAIKTVPSLFSFGSIPKPAAVSAVTTTSTLTSNLAPATTNPIVSSITTPSFGFSNPETSTIITPLISMPLTGISSTIPNSSTTLSSTFSFASTKPAEMPAATQDKALPFGSNTNYLPGSTGMFPFDSSRIKESTPFKTVYPSKEEQKYGSTEPKSASIFSVAEKTSSAFANVSKPPTTTASPITFGSSLGNNTSFRSSGSVFGGSGMNVTTSNIFANATLKEPTSTASPFAFRSSTLQPATQTVAPSFSFPQTSAQKPPVFSFSGSSSNPTTTAVPAFGSTNFTGGNPVPASPFSFNPSKQEVASFGQSPAPPLGGIFSTSQPQPPTNAPFQPSATHGFSFGSNAPATPAPSTSFNYASSAQLPVVAKSGFNYGSTGTFDPNTRPSFNFTGGNAPAVFNATPSATTQQSSRRIKKAVRRMPTR